MYHWFFFQLCFCDTYIPHGKTAHSANLPFKNFPMFIHTIHAALNLAPITEDNPLDSLNLIGFISTY